MNLFVRFGIFVAFGLGISSNQAFASPAYAQHSSSTSNIGDTIAAVSDSSTAEERSARADSSQTEESALDEPSDVAFGANFRWSFIKLPDFALNAIFDLYQGHWDDHPKYAFGGEFVIRYLNQHDIIFGVEYQNLATPDGLWLQRDDSISSANFTKNSLSTISFLIEYEYFASFLEDDALHVYVGLGAGISLVDGSVRTFEQNPACLNELDADDVEGLGSLVRGEPCGDDPDNDDLVLGYDRNEELLFSTREDIPSVLPAFKLTTGLRYMIEKKGSVAIEGGIFNAAFYFGLEVGFMIPTKLRSTRTHAGGLRDADD